MEDYCHDREKRYNLIGDRQFYKKVLLITLPIIVQNGITTFVNLLDNVMVGQVGTIPMSGVAIVNQLMFVFNLCIFGATSGAGIFTAQFFGKGDCDGLRYSVRFKLYTILAIMAVGGAILIPFGEDLITLFLTEGDTTGDVAMTLHYGREYLKVVLLSLAPMALTQVYAATLRETGHTVPPMVASVTAVCTNALCNWLLIFGIGPFPELGIRGAAIATVLHMLDFPLLFLAPGFYKLDFSELPVLLCGFYLGPSATVICEGIKILLKLMLKSTSTAFVGDLANFVVGCSFVLHATI